LESERSHKYNTFFIRIAGALAIIAGIVSLAAVFYLLIVLNNLGLNMSHFDNTAELLDWAGGHPRYYALLWQHYALAAVLLLPAPLATSSIYRHRGRQSSAWAQVSQVIGLCGLYLILLAAIIFFAVSPLSARFFEQNPETTIMLHEMFAAIGAAIRLLGELLVTLWLAMAGIYLITRKKIDILGWYLVALFALAFIITVGKLFALFDWEPFLGIVLALSYIWLGRTLRSEVA